MDNLQIFSGAEHWLITHNNIYNWYSKKKYSKAAAIKADASNLDCRFCTDCENCTGCVECNSCKDCKDCRLCQECNSCTNTLSCWECYNCKDIVEREKAYLYIKHIF